MIGSFGRALGAHSRSPCKRMDAPEANVRSAIPKIIGYSSLPTDEVRRFDDGHSRLCDATIRTTWNIPSTTIPVTRMIPAANTTLGQKVCPPPAFRKDRTEVTHEQDQQ